MKPQIEIEVDEDTGIWTTDGLPMLYVPRHFFVNNHTAVEDALGREKYQKILYDAGYKSAYFWCDEESKTHGIEGMEVFEHYLRRLSQRGWGQFSFASREGSGIDATIRLDHSSLVLQQPGRQGKLCYMFAGWFAGAMDWVSDQGAVTQRAVSCETQCAGEGEHHCVFTLSALA